MSHFSFGRCLYFLDVGNHQIMGSGVQIDMWSIAKHIVLLETQRVQVFLVVEKPPYLQTHISPSHVLISIWARARARLLRITHNSAHLAADWQVHMHAMPLPSLHGWLRQGPTSEWQVQRQQPSPMEVPNMCDLRRRVPSLQWWLRQGPTSEWPVQRRQASPVEVQQVRG